VHEGKIHRSTLTGDLSHELVSDGVMHTTNSLHMEALALLVTGKVKMHRHHEHFLKLNRNNVDIALPWIKGMILPQRQINN
jgi:hypothetical protein